MKRLLLIPALAVVTPVIGWAAAAEPAKAVAKSEADRDYEAIWADYRAPLPEGLTRKDRRMWELQSEKFLRLTQAARAFAAKYPHDPRRYEGLVQSSYTRSYFIVGFKPEFDATPSEKNLLVDQAALNAFRATQIKFLAAVVTAPDATPRQRGGAMHALIIDSRADANDRKVPFDVAPIRAVVEQAMRELADERALMAIDPFVAALKQQYPDEVKAVQAAAQAIPSLAAAYAAAETKRQEEAAARQVRLEGLARLKFTAADGREVDVAKLRGKVVLIDFWATWCGPCIAELPNVVANYRKYHAKGFEVIGVTLENSGVKPGETGEAAAEKLAAAKQKMLAFAASKEMPWPQHFDGKYWQSDLAKEFGVNSIPAMFLLDQDGKVVSTEARGERLEAELKRLLKL